VWSGHISFESLTEFMVIGTPGFPCAVRIRVKNYEETTLTPPESVGGEVSPYQIQEVRT
jgi:hypothetical protein